MASSNDVQRAAEKILDDEALISNLTDDEAKTLIDWAIAELETSGEVGTMETLDAKVQRIRKAMKEINSLVGNRQSLVADDLEERMAGLLVTDLDPKSQLRLALEREIAQVTAEKDHIAGAELVRRLTQVTTKAWNARTQAPAVPNAPTAANTAPDEPNASEPARHETPTRPTPRPTLDEPKKRSIFERLFGRK